MSTKSKWLEALVNFTLKLVLIEWHWMGRNRNVNALPHRLSLHERGMLYGKG